MGVAAEFLRKTESGFLHWCPGCKELHHIWVGNSKGPNWQFDGNVACPTFSPSVRHFTPARGGLPEQTLCHYFIRAGRIEYCGDCEHELTGQVVPLPPLPEGICDD